MKKLALVLAALVLARLGPAALADNPAASQWVLSSAKATGASGEQFVTSLRIVNPNTAAADVDLTYLPQSALDASGSALGDNSGATPVRVRVPAGQTLAIEDVVGTTFGTAGAGGILATTSSPVTPVSVVSRTYVANARSSGGIPGTYGLSIPGQTASDAIAVGDTGYIAYVSSSPSRISGFRSNVILQNTVKALTVVTLRLLKADGTPLGVHDYALGKLSATQINDVGSAFGYSADDTNLTVAVTVKSGGPVVVGATVIDNAISSVSYSPPTKVAQPSGAYGLVLDDGGYGFSGRLDISGGVPVYLSATVVLDGCPGAGGGVPYLLQAFATGSSRNTTFSPNADGSFSIAGSSTSAAWSGTVSYYADGSVFGRVTYARATGSLGGSCPGISRDIPFWGAKGIALTSP